MRCDSGKSRIYELVDSLLGRRVSTDENEICHLLRQVSEDEKLKVVEALGEKNVRLAAAVARRTHLATEQQATLLARLLVNGGSNEIKHYVVGLFVFRLRVKVVLCILNKYKDFSRRRASLAAYYFLSSKGFGDEYKRHFSLLVDGVKGEGYLGR